MKRFLTLLTTAMLLPAALSAANSGLEDLRGLVLTNAKLPVYNKQNLQMMVFCDHAERLAKTMLGTDVVLDLIRRGADIDSIRDGWGLKPYPLEAKLPEVVLFWSTRLYSDGLIFTAKADVDLETRLAYGDEPVFFRSPLLDLNGIGFEADLAKRTVLVREDVHIALRMESSDPRKLLAEKLPAKYDFVRATSDSLRIDMNNNQILLVGNVKVDEENSTLTCDRLTIYLDRQEDEALKSANDRGELDSSGMGNVSRVLCDGNVVVTRKVTEKEIAEHGQQQAFADHLVYDLVAGTVTLTGEDKQPVVKRGREQMSGDTITLHRAEQRVVLSRNSKVAFLQAADKPGQPDNVITVTSENALFDYQKNFGDFQKDVVVNDPRMQLKCAQMRIDLKEIAGEVAQLPEEASATLSGMPAFQAGNSRELDRISCFGGVEVLRRDEAGKLQTNERAVSREAVYDQLTGIITMTGDNPTLKRGGDSLSGKELQIAVNEERVYSRNGSRVALAARGGDPAQAGETIVLSESSDLNYGGNLLTFNENVKVNDPRMKLDCDKMDIFLLEQTDKPKKTAKNDSPLPELEGGNRSLSKVICTGRVKAVDPGTTLTSDKLTLHFQALQPGAAPGLFQSEGTELARIDADGNFKMVNTADTGDASASKDNTFAGLMKGGSNGARTISSDQGAVDFTKNISEFHGNVHVRDAESSLKCDDMFLFAGKAQEVEAALQASTPDIDDDPFALANASVVPTRINLTDSLDLTRVLCQNNVFFQRRTADGKWQKAKGNQADYVVASRKMYVTEEPGKQPWMSAEGQRMYGDRIIANVEDETMFAEGNTRTVPEK